MVRAIRKQLPDMPVLFMSGYAEESLRKDIDIPNMHFIAKPVSVSSISEKGRLCDEGGGPTSRKRASWLRHMKNKPE